MATTREAYHNTWKYEIYVEVRTHFVHKTLQYASPAGTALYYSIIFDTRKTLYVGKKQICT